MLLIGGSLAILWEPLSDAKRRLLLNDTLELLADGLRRHRELTGEYPPDPLLPASELVWMMTTSGALRKPPINPYTGQPYGADPFDLDQIWYSAGEEQEGWTLEALSEDGEEVLATKRPRVEVD